MAVGRSNAVQTPRQERDYARDAVYTSNVSNPMTSEEGKIFVKVLEDAEQTVRRNKGQKEVQLHTCQIGLQSNYVL